MLLLRLYFQVIFCLTYIFFNYRTCKSKNRKITNTMYRLLRRPLCGSDIIYLTSSQLIFLNITIVISTRGKYLSRTNILFCVHIEFHVYSTIIFKSSRNFRHSYIMYISFTKMHLYLLSEKLSYPRFYSVIFRRNPRK